MKFELVKKTGLGSFSYSIEDIKLLSVEIKDINSGYRYITVVSVIDDERDNRFIRLTGITEIDDEGDAGNITEEEDTEVFNALMSFCEEQFRTDF